MPTLTRPPGAPVRTRRGKRKRAARARRTYDDVFQRLETALGRWKLLLGVVVPVYTFARIFVFTRADRSVMLEVVRRQGISGIAQAALTSVTSELGGLSLLASLMLLGFLFTDRGARVLSRQRTILVPVTALAAAVLILVVPWTMVAAVAVVTVAALVGVGKGAPRATVWIIMGAAASIIVLGLPLVTRPWLPRERLSWAASTQRTELGYVLGDGQRFTSLLKEKDRKVLLIPTDAITDRQVCRTAHGWISFDAPSIAERAWKQTRECDAPPEVGDPPTSIVLCLAPGGDAVVRVVTLPDACGPDARPVILNQTGPKGEKGDAGAKGDTGPKGEKGDKGDPGARQAWALVGPDGRVLFSSQTVASRSDPRFPNLLVVRFEGLNLTGCAVTAQSASQGVAGSAVLTNVVLPAPGSNLPLPADLTAGEVVAEITTFGKDDAVGLLVTATCPA